MTHLQNEKVSLRAVEPEDIDLLFDLENDISLWKYSNRLQPYSRDLLQKYIANAHKDIFEIRQINLLFVLMMIFRLVLLICLTLNLYTIGQE